MSEILAQSPLVQARRLDHANASPAEAGVRLQERPFLGYLNLRGDPDSVEFTTAVQGVLGVVPPTVPNTLVQGGDCTVFWLGPDEWLIVTPAGAQDALALNLDTALANQHAAVTDVSSGLTCVRIAGPQMRQVLASACTLDLHPRAFLPGQCAQTLLAKTGITLWLEDDAFQLVVRRSFADHLWRWLEDAAWEVGFVVED